MLPVPLDNRFMVSTTIAQLVDYIDFMLEIS